MHVRGQWILPYYLFAGKRIPVTYNRLEGGVPGCAFSMREGGYMDTSSFYMWLANHFIPQRPPTRPVVLLVDSHESHIDLDSFELARKNGIHIYALLKNATHLVQPADVGLFGAMKQTWYKNARRHSQNNPNKDINKKNFCSVFRATWDDVMRPSLLVDAFRTSGIFPLDRAHITDVKVKASLVYTATTQITTSSPASNKENSTESSPLPLTSCKFTSSPPPTDTAANTSRAFDALESSLNTPTTAKYRHRIEEGYDLPDPVLLHGNVFTGHHNRKRKTEFHHPKPSANLSRMLQQRRIPPHLAHKVTLHQRDHLRPSLMIYWFIHLQQKY